MYVTAFKARLLHLLLPPLAASRTSHYLSLLHHCRHMYFSELLVSNTTGEQLLTLQRSTPALSSFCSSSSTSASSAAAADPCWLPPDKQPAAAAALDDAAP
jgi:hypothetical protein